MVYAADLWNLVLDSTAKSDDLPMGPGTPRFYLAQLVLGSVFIEYLSHFSLIPSRLTYLQERGGETTASLSSAIYMADSSFLK